jgi:hypothetical protein
LNFPTPSTSSSSSVALETERVLFLQQFFLYLFKITSYNSLHPSIVQIQYYFNKFLEVDKHTVEIQLTLKYQKIPPTSEDPFKSNLIGSAFSSSASLVCAPPSHASSSHCYNMIRVYVRSIFLLNSLDTVLEGFTSNYIQMNKVQDLSEKSWTTVKASTIYGTLRTFMKQIQNFILEYFIHDFEDIIRYFLTTKDEDITEEDTSTEQKETWKFSSRQLIKQPSSETVFSPASLTIGSPIVNSIDYDALNRNIRKQTEMELYIRCVDRIKYVGYHSLEMISKRYLKRLEEINRLPLSFFDIDEHFLSYHSWNLLIEKFQLIQYPVLPIDKLEALVVAYRAISIIYYEERKQEEVVDEEEQESEFSSRKNGHLLEDDIMIDEEIINKTSPQQRKKTLGADEIIPCLIYCLCHAKISNLIFINFELQELTDPDTSLSEAGYCLASLEGAIQHILEADLTSFKVSPSTVSSRSTPSSPT